MKATVTELRIIKERSDYYNPNVGRIKPRKVRWNGEVLRPILFHPPVDLK